MSTNRDPAHSRGPGGRPDHLSPNQQAKRRQVIDAARTVLVEHGLAGFTVRAVADASPLTKSAVHYYFADIDELLDAAMTAHIDAFIASLRDVAAATADPKRRFWAVMNAYMAAFDERPQAAFLWFEYWAAAARRGETEAIERMLQTITHFLAEQLANISVENPPATAARLLSYLLGAVAQQRVHQRPFTDLRNDIRVLCRLSDGRHNTPAARIKP